MHQTLIRFSTLLSTLLIAVSASAQPITRDLRIVFNAEQYVSTVYSGSPVPGSRIYFDDEPLRLQVGIVNWTDETLMLRTGGASAGNLISVRLQRRGESGAVDVPVRLSLNGDPLIGGESQQSVVSWQETISVPAKWYVTIPMLVRTDRLEPGTYELRVDQIRGSCEPNCGIRNHGGLFVFDISHVDTLPKQLDQLFRRAHEAIERGTVTEADPLLKRMLELYPQASAAYQLLARRAEQVGNWKEAAAAYERALDLVQTGADRLRSHSEPQALIDGLREKATRARRQQEKK
jgi:hypothetical protein